jgi:DNA-binding MarR family transcriptional regulator
MPGDAEVVAGWHLFNEAHNRIAAAIRRDLAHHHGLDPAAFDVLLQLSRAPEQRRTASELAAEVSFSSGGFTKLADRLERAGFVARRQSRQDRRRVWITLAPAGAEVLAAAATRLGGLLRRELWEPLGPEGFATFTDSLGTLAARARSGPTALR